MEKVIGRRLKFLIKLLEIKAKNFKSWKELSLPDLDNEGLCLISGKIGQGKSSIRHIVEYLLTDDTAEGLDLENLPYNTDTECMMYGKFDRDGDIIEITKYRNSKEFKNNTILTINGDSSKTTTDRRETQKVIEEELGITKDSLLISTMFSKNSPSFSEVKDSDRKKIIYDAKNLQKYNKYEEKAKASIASLEKEILDKEIKLKVKTDHNSELIKDLLSLDEKISKYKILQKNKLKELAAEKDEIKLVSTSIETIFIENMKEFKKEFKKDIESHVQNKDFLDDVIKKLLPYIEEKNSIKLESTKDLKAELEELESNPDEKVEDLSEQEDYITELESSLNSLSHKIYDLNKKIKDASSGICPILTTDCQYLLDRKDRAEQLYRPEIDAAEKERVIKTTELKGLEAEFKIKSDRNKEIETLKQEKKLAIQKLKSSIELIEFQNSTIDSRKESIDNQLHMIIENEISSVKNKIKLIENDNLNKEKRKISLEKDISALLNEENPYIKSKEDEELKIKIIFEDIDILKKEIKVIKDELRYYMFWKKGYSKKGIPNLKADGFLEALEIETNKILSVVGSTTYVSIESDNEKVAYKVHDVNGNKVTSFKSYSGGEKQKIKIADILAFNKLLGKFNFIFMDEILEGSLDEEGKEGVLQLIRLKLTDINNIFVMSHSFQIKDSFDNSMLVKKSKGVSYIEEKLC
jgi:DNA repair exonuclease SbcCD ATPase subunit